MDLPIEVVPRTNPPHFRWDHTLPDGRKVYHEGPVPSAMEGSLVQLIDTANKLAQRNEELQQANKELSEKLERAEGAIRTVIAQKGGKK